MSINNHWRNKQLNNQLLWQEVQCLAWCQQHPFTIWSWHGANSYFREACQSTLDFGHPANGVIIINTPWHVSVPEFVSTVKGMIHENITVAYLAINRYEFRIDQPDDSWPDTLDQCLDLIAFQCDQRFRRLYHPESVDGKHFVGSHGLDVYVYD